MKLAIFTLGLICAVVVVATNEHSNENVLRFDIKQAENEFLDSWIQKLRKTIPGRLTTFKYNNCGDPAKEVGDITKFVISPDPLVFPGTLTVDFAGTAKASVSSPISGVLLLQVKVGSNWVKIPCIGQIGSCTYDDLCELLDQIPQCPQPLVDAGIPCKCPFPQGPYNLPQASFDVNIAILPPGDYHAVANITNSGTSVACVELFVTLG